MMKKIILDQYRNKIDRTVHLKNINRPKEGWIRTLRKALGMSGPQLAARLGISKSQASQIERMETEDRITLKQLRRVAGALDCELVYALVPRNSVSEMIASRASYKAQLLAGKANVQMQLEDQDLPKERLNKLIEIEKDRLLKQMPRNLWED